MGKFYQLRLFSVFFCLFLTNTYLLAFDTTTDGFFISEDEEEALYNFSEELPSGCEDADNLAGAMQLVELFKINEPFTQPFYLRTQTLSTRPIHTLPSLSFYGFKNEKRATIQFQGFFNQTSKLFFMPHDQFIKSYLAVGENSPFELINNDEITAATKFDLIKLMRLFSCAKIEERRVGLFFTGYHHWDTVSFEWATPLLYQERNFILSEEEIHRIKSSEALINLGGSTTDKESEDRAKKFVVADKVGIGDTHCSLRYHCIDTDTWKLNGGIQATIPTAVAFKSGLIGSHFRAQRMRPAFNLRNLICLALIDLDNNIDEIRMAASKLALHASDWVAANILDAPLGNEHHFGIGCFVESYVALDTHAYIKGKASIEHLFSHYEPRLFRVAQDRSFLKSDILTEHREILEDAINSGTAQEIALAAQQVNHDFALLDEAIIDFIFPPLCRTLVRPGYIAQLTLEPHVRTSLTSHTYLDVGVGYDLWYQGGEKIKSVSAPSHSSNQLDIASGTRSSARQQSMFTHVAYKKYHEDYDISLSLKADKVFGSYGIGRSFGASLGLVVEF